MESAGVAGVKSAGIEATGPDSRCLRGADRSHSSGLDRPAFGCNRSALTRRYLRRGQRDYARMGVANIWLVDPHTRTGQEFRDNRWVEVSEFVVPSTPIKIALAELFTEFDRFNQAAEKKTHE